MWLSVFTRVFSKGRYLVLSLGVFAISASLVLLLPNWVVLKIALTSDAITILEKLTFWLSLYGSITTNYGIFSAFSIVALLVLFSIDISLLIFYMRRTQKVSKGFKRSRARSLVGAISGVLGIGCAACGSVILTGVAASLGATGILLMLPLHGGEFAWLGIALLIWSISYLVKKIHDPLICPSKS